MRFIEIADEEALNLPADQLKAIATYSDRSGTIQRNFLSGLSLM